MEWMLGARTSGILAGLILTMSAGSAAAHDRCGWTCFAAVPVVADTFVRDELYNANEGGSHHLRLLGVGSNRPILRVDQAAIDAILQRGSLYGAQLRVYAHANVGQFPNYGMMVDAHRLLMGWAEGNGWRAELPSGQGPDNGTGSGATWSCPADTDISNDYAECNPQWNMWSSATWSYYPTDSEYVPWPGAGSWLSFSVANDLWQYSSGIPNHGWMLKLSSEGYPEGLLLVSRDSADWRRPALEIEYYSSTDSHYSNPPLISADPPIATIDAGQAFVRDIDFVDSDSAGWTALLKFGDGSADESMGVTQEGFQFNHVYAEPGVYQASVKITDQAGAWGRYDFEITVVQTGPSVSAGPDASVMAGVAFTRSGSFSDPGGSSWFATVDYDDGAGQEPLTLAPDKTFLLSHVYSTGGMRTVVVEVCRQGGACGTDSVNVNVLQLGGGVVADFEIVGALHEEGRPVLFHDLSQPADGSLSYQWMLVDGAGPSTDQNPVWFYAQSGTYTVCLMVSNSAGADMECKEVVIADSAPTVRFAVSGVPREGEPLQFTNQTREGADAIEEWRWDFGDGVTSGVESPSHTYARDGGPSACLSARDADGTWSAPYCLNLVVENVAPSIVSISPAPQGTHPCNGSPIRTTPGGVALELSASATDPGSDDPEGELSYAWDLDGDGVFERAGRAVSFESNVKTVHYPIVKVTDTDGASVTAVVPVRVGSGELPLARIRAPSPTTEGRFVFLDASTSADPCGSALQFAWDLDGDGAYDDAETATTLAQALDDPTTTFRVRVTNTLGNASIATAAVQVTNSDPALQLLASAPVLEGASFVFRGQALDTGADIVTLEVHWSWLPGQPPDETFGPAAGGPFARTHVYPDEGTRTVRVRASDEDGGSSVREQQVVVLNADPEVSFAATEPWITAGVNQDIDHLATATDPGAGDVLSAEIEWGDGSSGWIDPVTPSGQLPLHHSYALEGCYLLTVFVDDHDGGAGARGLLVIVEASAPAGTPPAWAPEARLTAEVVSSTRVDLRWDPAAPTTTAYVLLMDAQPIAWLDRVETSFEKAGLDPGTEHVFEIRAGDADGNWSQRGPKARARTLVDTPTISTPPLDGTVVPSLSDALSFLYSGLSPIQAGADPGAFEAHRIAGIRGTVVGRDGNGIAGARVSILGHPEYGWTGTRPVNPAGPAPFDLAVNGGGSVTIHVERTGYLPVQRSVHLAWNEWTEIEPIVLTGLDAATTTVSFPTVGYVRAHSDPVADGEGARRATILFAPGTTASWTIPGEPNAPPPTTLTFRITEYTVGTTGLAAMPGSLPKQSAYTYAADITADEEIAVGATTVTLNPPAIFYTMDFRGFPPGTPIPVGWYDATRGIWVPEATGLVIKILGYAGELAQIDADSDPQAETDEDLAGLGINGGERAALAAMADVYPPGTVLWRAVRAHFSPLDGNVPPTLPGDWVPPGGGPPTGAAAGASCPQKGSIIGVEDQTLGEVVPIQGTSFALHYQTDRQPGYRAQNVINVPLTGPDPLPASLRAILVEVRIAGQLISQPVPPPYVPEQRTTVTWDGKDAFGRHVSGSQVARVRVGYVYQNWYNFTGTRFAVSGRSPGGGGGGGGGGALSVGMGFGGNRSQVVWSEWEVGLGHIDAGGLGLGGFTITPHHVYDEKARKLYRGDGTNDDAQALGPVITHVAGRSAAATPSGDGGPASEADFVAPTAMAIGPDGSIYVAESGANHRAIRKIDPAGIIRTIAGGNAGCAPFTDPTCGDGSPAVDARFVDPVALAVGPDGSVFVVDRGLHTVRRVRPDGVIERFAGQTDLAGSSGDGGKAVEARLNAPEGIAVAPDGTIYVADTGNYRVRQITPSPTSDPREGVIVTIAGNGQPGSCADPFGSNQTPNAARDQAITAHAVTIGPDGDVYVTGGTQSTWSERSCVMHLRADGAIRRLAGDGQAPGFGGDGGPAWLAKIDLIGDFGAMGGIFGGRSAGYIADLGNNRIRKITMDGIIHTIAGTDLAGNSDDGIPAASAALDRPFAVAEGPDGSVYVFERMGGPLGVSGRLRKIAPTPAGRSDGELIVPSSDGRVVYVFGANRRHVRTVDATSGAWLYTFEYDSDGLLTEIREPTRGADYKTLIERQNGVAQAIVAPHGQRTELVIEGGKLETIRHLGAYGYASVQWDFAYHPTGPGAGLLSEMHHPRPGADHVSWFEYDAQGRLERDRQPGTSAPIELSPEPWTPEGYKVRFESPMNRTTTYEVQRDAPGVDRRVITSPDGRVRTMVSRPDGSDEVKTYASAPQPGTDPFETKLVVEYGPDPRFGMQVPLVKRSELTVTTGGAPITQVVTREREVTLADPNDPLSVRRVVDRARLNSREYVYDHDVAARTVTSRTPEGRTAVTTLDGVGRPIRIAQPGRAPLDLHYDAAGRLDWTRHAGTRHDLAYDAQGFLERVTSPEQEVTMIRHSNGAVERTTLAGDTTRFEYDQSGNPTSIRPPGRPAHVFDHTPRDLPSLYSPPQVGAADMTVTAAYNPDGQQIEATTPDEAIAYGYDPLSGKLAWINAGGVATTFGYSPTTKRLESVSRSGAVTVSYAYQGALPESVSWGDPVGGEVTIGYDQDLRVGQLQVSGQPAILYGYDDDGLITSAGALTLTRDPVDGSVAQADLGGLREIWVTGWDGRLSSHRLEGLHEAKYERDRIGRITKVTESENGACVAHGYDYDAAGRLERVRRKSWTCPTESGAWETVAEYRYDANGNRLYEITPLGASMATYDAQDRLTTYTKEGVTSTYLYSGRGTLGQVICSPTPPGVDATTTYQYDAFGNLLGVQKGALNIEYLVDATNRRVGKRRNGSLEKTWIYQDALEPVLEWDPAQGWTQYVYAAKAHVPSYMVRNGTAYYMYTDHLGSVRRVVSPTGQVVQKLDYDAWGNLLPTSTNVSFQPFGFAGGLYDPDTRLVRFGERDYDPFVGRWTARDPILFGGGQTNLLAYVANDPVNWIDPEGRFALVPAIIFAITLSLSISSDNDANLVGVLPAAPLLRAAGAGAMCVAAATSPKCVGGMCNGLTCFVSGTPVSTVNGPRAIEEIVEGELVLSMSDESGEIAYKPVTRTFATPDRTVIDLILVDSDGKPSTLGVTPEHPLWSLDRGWVSAGDLLPGEELATPDGHGVLVAGASSRTQTTTVYNLEVADFHTYFAGDLEAWVHNACDPNKLHHIFGQVRHKLGPVVEHFGSREAAFDAIQTATESAVKSGGVTGIFETAVEVGGTNITVRGAVVDGAVKIGTAFVP